MVFITSDQLADLLQALVLLSLLVGIAAVLVGQWLHGVARGVARWFEKRGKPPSPALMRLVAKNLRARAEQLEVRAARATQK